MYSLNFPIFQERHKEFCKRRISGQFPWLNRNFAMLKIEEILKPARMTDISKQKILHLFDKFEKWQHAEGNGAFQVIW